jgi:hypothetical protein
MRRGGRKVFGQLTINYVAQNLGVWRILNHERATLLQ